MANMFWRGGSVAVAQVDSFRPDDDDGTLYSITATDDEGHSSKCATTVHTSEQAIVEALKAAADLLKAQGIGPWDEITASENDATLTLTCDTPGKPIYYDVSECVGDAITHTNMVANKGPYDWNDLGNWEGDGDLPGNDVGDVVYVENATIKYGLNQLSAAQTLTALYITKSQIGQYSVDNLPLSYLQIKYTTANINYNNEPGTPTFLSPVNLDSCSVASTTNIYGAATATTKPTVNIKANHATSVVRVYAGTVGIANNAGETSTLDKVDVLGGSCYVGSGVTLATVLNRVGSSNIRCALTTLNLDSGTALTEGSGAIGTVNINGGTATLSASGTISNLNAIKGTADLTKSTVLRTVTTPKIGSGGVYKYDPAVITNTNPVAMYNSSGEITLTAA